MTIPSFVLFVDDDPLSNFVNRLLLAQTAPGIGSTAVESAREALDYLTASGKYLEDFGLPQPGLVFLDLNLGVMNGWDFLDEYSLYPNTFRNRSRLYILTASPNPDDREQARQYRDVLGYLVKPLSKKNLAECLRGGGFEFYSEKK
ncbi:MAG: response regulator [Leptospiraceae bacterium]|nr:response regulator [Leptospiraceae bacterium]